MFPKNGQKNHALAIYCPCLEVQDEPTLPISQRETKTRLLGIYLHLMNNCFPTMHMYQGQV